MFGKRNAKKEVNVDSFVGERVFISFKKEQTLGQMRGSSFRGTLTKREDSYFVNGMEFDHGNVKKIRLFRTNG